MNGGFILKKIIILLIAIFSISCSYSVYASVSESSNLLPKGDEYFNPENFYVENNFLKNKYPIRVKPSTEYVFAFFYGPSDDFSLSDLLINDGIASMARIQIDLESGSISDLMEDDKYNAPGSTTYFCFKTMEDDDYINRIQLLIPYEIQEDVSNWKWYFHLFEYWDKVQYVDMIGFYIDPLPPLEDVIYEQAIREGIYYVSIDNIPSSDDIKKMLRANDNSDGDISDRIYLESSIYEGVCEPIGEYKMVYAVKDSANNKETFTITLRVVDVTPPKIIGPSSLVVNMGMNNEEYYKTLLTVRDNFDLEPILTVKQSNLDPMKPGIYFMIFEAIDSSGNRQEFQMNIRVHDNYAPVITASSIILDVDYANQLTIEQIKEIIGSRVKVMSDDITIIYNDYTNNEGIPGEYRIEYMYISGEEIITDSVKINVSGEEKESINKEMVIGCSVLGVLIGGLTLWLALKKYKLKKSK